MTRRFVLVLSGSIAVAAAAVLTYAAAPGGRGEASGNKTPPRNAAEKIAELEKKVAALESADCGVGTKRLRIRDRGDRRDRIYH